MGQEQNKNHVTNDGKIFSVMNDGSVSEIGNVSSLLDNNKNGEKKEQLKSRKWMWIAMFSWIVLIVSCITFLVIQESSTDFIRHLNYLNYDLEQKLNQVQSELSSKSAELDSIHQQIRTEKQNRIPITVTGVQFANESYYSELIDNYGSILYSSRICFLKPKISFTGRKSGSYTLTEKLIRPDGSVLHGDSSPENATQSFSINTSPGRNGQTEISSWGWKDPGNYEAGRWTLQIGYDDILIYSTTFDIQ